MAALLRRGGVTDEQRLANDAHTSPHLVVAVLAMLVLYMLLVTPLPAYLGLGMPQEWASHLGVHLPHLFDDDGNVESEIRIYKGDRSLTPDEQRFVLLLMAAGAFLSAYFLPLRHKRRALVAWFLAAAATLFGVAGVSGLLFAHLVIYLLFHRPGRVLAFIIPFAAGLLGALAFSPPDPATPLWGLYALALYRVGMPWLRGQPLLLRLLRGVAIQSAMITVMVGATFQGLGGSPWSLPLGILLFFWQWERLIFYHLDYGKGDVPETLPLDDYLSLFLTPPALGNWNWGVTIGQGYTYLNAAFLCEEKNRLVVEGLKIWAVALLYLLFDDWVRWMIVDVCAAYGIDIHRALVRRLVEEYVATGSATTAEVLLTTLADLIRWFLVWGAALHFKTGLWRVCGYRMDPYFNRPWLATNLVVLWGRFTFHYREFLVRAFFYPVFFRWFKGHARTRIFVATMAAACFGNLAWGHIPEEFFYHGMRWENLGRVLQTWPYFLLLGVGISCTELYLLQKRQVRKPWSRDRRLPLDLLSAYLTIQFYALIHIFFYPCEGGSLGAYWHLFLIGLGFS